MNEYIYEYLQAIHELTPKKCFHHSCGIVQECYIAVRGSVVLILYKCKVIRIFITSTL